MADKKERRILLENERVVHKPIYSSTAKISLKGGANADEDHRKVTKSMFSFTMS